MCRNDGVNHVIAQCVNHVSLDKIAAATVGIPYIERYHSSEQVVFDTWRSASCRPYDKIVMNYLISDVSGIVLRPKNVKNVVL